MKEYTGLKEASLPQFMEFCQIPNKLIEQATKYEILVAMDECYTDFKDPSYD